MEMMIIYPPNASDPQSTYSRSRTPRKLRSHRSRGPRVDRQDDSGDRPGIASGQEAGPCTHVPAVTLDLDEAAVPATLTPLIAHAAGVHHGRVDHAGADAVDADVVGGVVGGHGPCHVDHSALGRRIHEVWRAAQQAGDGSQVDDAAADGAWVPGHGRDGVLGHADHAEDVDGEPTRPLVERRLRRLPLAPLIPTLFTSMSRLPNVARARSTTRRQSASDVTSAVTASPRALPSASIILTVCSSTSCRTSTQTTAAPSSARRTAAAGLLPMPTPAEPAPVTMATLPWSDRTGRDVMNVSISEDMVGERPFLNGGLQARR